MNLSDRMMARASRLIVRDNAPIGLVIHDRYEVEDRIARGGMGEIFRARDLRLNRPVAMKILGARLTDPEWTARFETEARTMGQIDHPGIVPIHDLGILPDGRLYYTMKLLEGLTVDALIESGENRRSLLRALVRTCRIVHHAHEQGIIHRDLKPTNIMVDDNEETYVLDWGIARVMDEVRVSAGEGAMTAVGLTSAGTILGTVQYMPPEQARGDLASIDARSDVYSLGAILYEILTGLPPVTGSNVTEILDAASEGKIEPPRELDPSLPPDLEAICLKALSKRQARRYGSAAELADDLERWMTDTPVRAYSGAPTYVARKLLRKHRALAAVTLVAALSILGFGVYWLATGEDRTLAAEKKAEDEIFGDILMRLESLGDHPAGWKRGAQLLRSGLAQYPDSWKAWETLAQYHEKLSEYDKALDAYARVLALNPVLGSAHFRRGKILMDGKKDLGKALEEFEAALRVGPENEFALVSKARVAAIRGDYRGALEVCSEVETEGEHLSELHFLRGFIRSREEAPGFRNLKEAIKHYDKAIELSPTAAVLYVFRGLAYQDLKTHTEAILDFNRSLKLNPDDPVALTNRGNSRREEGDLDGALEDQNRAIELDGAKAPPYASRGSVYEAKGDYDKAIADFDKAISIDPGLAKAWSNRGRLRNERGDREGAARDHEKAIELDPKNANSYVNRGVSLADRGDLEGAMRDYARAIEFDPETLEAYVNRAICRYRTGDLLGAVADGTKAIELAPQDGEIYMQRGMAHYALKKLDPAIADLTRATELRPGDARIWTNRGLIWHEKGDLKKAIADHTKATQVNPKLPGGWSNRARARVEARDFDGAISDCTKVIELAPKHVNARVHRGNAKAQKGDLAGAAKDWQEALDLAPPRWPFRKPLEAALKRINQNR